MGITDGLWGHQQQQRANKIKKLHQREKKGGVKAEQERPGAGAWPSARTRPCHLSSRKALTVRSMLLLATGPNRHCPTATAAAVLFLVKWQGRFLKITCRRPFLLVYFFKFF